jgi:hypothetical protein
VFIDIALAWPVQIASVTEPPHKMHCPGFSPLKAKDLGNRLALLRKASDVCL